MIKIVLGALLAILASSVAHADWHYGTIDLLGYGYDGQTITFHITGWNRTDCTCYPSWPDKVCLDRNRLTFKEELATLLAAKISGSSVAANIDETTCTIRALLVTQ